MIKRIITPSVSRCAFPGLSDPPPRLRAVSTPQGPVRPQRAEPLSVREGRQQLGVPYEGVPAHLERQLRVWLADFLGPDLERRVALQLEVELTPREFYADDSAGPPQELYRHPRVDLLDAADVAMQLDEELRRQFQRIDRERESSSRAVGAPTQRAELAVRLAKLLDDANSVYRVGRGPDDRLRVLRRLDPSVQAAAEEAIATAEPTAGDLLRRSWTAAYSRTPTPPSAYRDAVLAVETLTSPAVLPTDRAATLGKVINHLRDAADKWELGLADDGGGRAVDDIRGMFSLLWRGEDRHGGRDYEDVTLAEARAAVHLAVTLVQWLTDGVLRPRTAPSTP